MKILKTTISVLVLVLTNSSYAFAAPYSVRDMTLGMPIQEACSDAEIKYGDDFLNNISEHHKSTLEKLGYKQLGESHCTRKRGVPDGISANEEDGDPIIGSRP